MAPRAAYMSSIAKSDQTEAQAFECAIVIPLFNKAGYIERALASVASQTLAPKEIIVIDDGSTDNGPEKVAALALADPRIRLIRQANAGVSAARNRGIRETNCAWIAFLDADDAHLPWFLEEMALLSRLCPDAELLGGNFVEAVSSFRLSRSIPEQSPVGTFRGRISRIYDRWWHGSLFFTSSVAVNRRVLEEMIEPFPISERHGEDLELFFRLIERGRVAWTSRVSALYAVGVDGSLTSSGMGGAPIPAFQRLLSRVERRDFPADERPGARRCLATYWMTLARSLIRRGEFADARILLKHPITVYRPVYRVRTSILLVTALLRQSSPWQIASVLDQAKKRVP